MAKTKIDDLPKGAEEMDAEEQKAAKGGRRAPSTAVEHAVLARPTALAQAQTAAIVRPSSGSSSVPTDLRAPLDPKLTR